MDRTALPALFERLFVQNRADAALDACITRRHDSVLDKIRPLFECVIECYQSFPILGASLVDLQVGIRVPRGTEAMTFLYLVW